MTKRRLVTRDFTVMAAPPVYFLDLDKFLLLKTDPTDGGYTYEGPRLQPWHGPGLDLDIPPLQAATSDRL